LRELLPHKDEIDPKYGYLFSGPLADPDGNPAIVRYSRKNKEQYLMSEVDGKANKWRAFYRNGKWQEEQGGAR
jgi:DNA topoisomerase-1